MPIYEYRCQDCGQVIEVLHGVDATGPTTCDVCGGPLRKMVSAPAIVFKGSGWAKKDAHAASSKAAASRAEKDKAATGAAGAATGGGGEAKGASAGSNETSAGSSGPSAGSKESSGGSPDGPATRRAASGGD